MNQKITPKQKGFAKDVVETQNPTEAAIRNYSCKNRRSAALVAFENMRKPLVVREIEQIMEDRELTDETVVQKLKDGLEANVITDYMGEAEVTEIPDFKTRHKYLESVIDIKGLKAPQRTESVNLDIKLESMSLQDIVMEVQRQLKLLEAGV